jgi:hypothetical protein
MADRGAGRDGPASCDAWAHGVSPVPATNGTYRHSVRGNVAAGEASATVLRTVEPLRAGDGPPTQPEWRGCGVGAAGERSEKSCTDH